MVTRWWKNISEPLEMKFPKSKCEQRMVEHNVNCDVKRILFPIEMVLSFELVSLIEDWGSINFSWEHKYFLTEKE